MQSRNLLAGLEQELVGGKLTAETAQLHRSVLCVFCICYSHLLSVQDDEEFAVRQTPFELLEIKGMVREWSSTCHRLSLCVATAFPCVFTACPLCIHCLSLPQPVAPFSPQISSIRDLAASLYLLGGGGGGTPSTVAALGGDLAAALEDVAGTRHALKAMSHLLRRLYTRDARRGFCGPDHWVFGGCSGVQAAAVVNAVVDVNDPQHDKWGECATAWSFLCLSLRFHSADCSNGCSLTNPQRSDHRPGAAAHALRRPVQLPGEDLP